MPAPKTRTKRRSISVEDEDGIWEFIHKSLVVQQSRDEINLELWKDFINETGSTFSPKELDSYYNDIMATSLYKSDIDPKKILELYKHLKIPVTAHVENLLEQIFSSVLRFNRDRVLVSYKFIGQRQEMENPPAPPVMIDDPTPPPRRVPTSNKVFVTPPPSAVLKKKPSRILNWDLKSTEKQPEVAPREKEPTSSKRRRSARLRSPMRDPSPVTARSPTRRQEKSPVRTPSPVIASSPHRRREESPIQEEIPDRNPSFDDSDWENDFKVEYKPKPSIVRKVFGEQEHIAIWKYIYNKIYDSKNGKPTEREILPKGLAFWKAYVRETGSKRTEANLSSHFRKKMLSDLHELPIRKIQILRLHEMLEIPVTEKMVRGMEERFKARIKVEEGLIVGWRYRSDEDEKYEEEDVFDLTDSLKSRHSSSRQGAGKEKANRKNKKTDRKRNCPIAVLSDSEKDSDEEMSSKRKKRGNVAAPAAEKEGELESTEPLSSGNGGEENPVDTTHDIRVRRPERPERPRRLSEANETHAYDWFGLDSYHPANYVNGTIYQHNDQTGYSRQDNVQLLNTYPHVQIPPVVQPVVENIVPVRRNDIVVKTEDDENILYPDLNPVFPIEYARELSQMPLLMPVHIPSDSPEIIENAMYPAGPSHQVFQDARLGPGLGLGLEAAVPTACFKRIVPYEDTYYDVDLASVYSIRGSESPLVERTSEVQDSQKFNDDLISIAMENFERNLKTSLISSNHQNIMNAVLEDVRKRKVKKNTEIDEITTQLINLSVKTLETFRNEKADSLKPQAVAILRNGMQKIPVVHQKMFDEMIELVLLELKNCAWNEKSYLTMAKSAKSIVQEAILNVLQ